MQLSRHYNKALQEIRVMAAAEFTRLDEAGTPGVPVLEIRLQFKQNGQLREIEGELEVVGKDWQKDLWAAFKEVGLNQYVGYKLKVKQGKPTIADREAALADLEDEAEPASE